MLLELLLVLLMELLLLLELLYFWLLAFSQSPSSLLQWMYLLWSPPLFLLQQLGLLDGLNFKPLVRQLVLLG